MKIPGLFSAYSSTRDEDFNPTALLILMLVTHQDHVICAGRYVVFQDNPADFSYFFDTSRRRTCYIAPERFVESSWRNSDPTANQAGTIDLTTSEVKKGDLTPAMDIFSAG